MTEFKPGDQVIYVGKHRMLSPNRNSLHVVSPFQDHAPSHNPINYKDFLKLTSWPWVQNKAEFIKYPCTEFERIMWGIPDGT